MIDAEHQRRAIEALRAGVPSRAAVRLLGCHQPVLEERFRRLLAQAADEPEQQAPGLLVAGDFGTGKSHLLDYLQHLALEARAACSRIVISKETPLYDPVKLFRAASEGMALPGRRGVPLTELASLLDLHSPAYTAFRRWVEHSPLDRRFAALLYLFEHGDRELRDRILATWGGDPFPVGELKRCLRACGEAASYAIGKAPPAAELARQRFQFLARLVRAAGFAGWVLLIDEVELIGRYSLNQRARSYAEIARWAGLLADERYPGLACVMAITQDFANEVVIERGDQQRVAAKFGDSPEPAGLLLASQAERGLQWLLRDAQSLARPDQAAIDAIYGRLQQLHGEAYNWDPPPVAGREHLTTTRLREYIRSWINAWDLKRLFPDYEPETEITELTHHYDEQPELEAEA